MKSTDYSPLLRHARIGFAFLFFLTTLTLQAQSYFRPGFIITLQQDTIYGEIDLRLNSINAHRCTFRATGSNEIQNFAPFDILGYRFTQEGKFYVSKAVELAPEDPDTVFLEFLLQGMRSLYYYETEQGVPIYFVQVGDRLVRVDAPQLSKNEGPMFTWGEGRYQPILRVVFDSPKVQKEIDKVKYTRQSMIQLARDYHYATCTTGEDCIEFETAEAKTPPATWTFTPYVGIIQQFTPGKHKQLAGVSIPNPKLSYVGGVMVTVTNPRWSNIVSLTADLSLSKYQGDWIWERSRAIIPRPDTPPYYETHYNVILYNNLLMSGKLGVRFTRPKGTVRPFAGIGVSLSGFLGTKKNVEQNDLYEEKEVYDYWNKDKNLYAGYYIDAGVSIKLSKHDYKNMIMARIRYNAIPMPDFSEMFSRSLECTVGYTF
jgi:hypothetical protein